MANKEKIISYLKDIKSGKLKLDIDFFNESGQKIGKLLPIVDSEIRDNSEIVKLMTKWRRDYKDKFFTQFEVTEERTKNWLDNQIIKRDNRIFFVIETSDKKLIGHIGVIFFEEGDSICELDNFVKDRDCQIPGIMTYATKALINFLFNSLKMKKLKLRVFSDNLRAQELYFRCGFSKVKEIGFKKEVTDDGIKYVEIRESDNQVPNRTMYLFELENNPPYLKVRR